MKNNEQWDEELLDWIEALENTILTDGKKHTEELLDKLNSIAATKGLNLDRVTSWPMRNTVSSYQEEDYPGNWEYEEIIRHYIRWNSLAMVLKANKSDDLGGHISTYSSAASLYEVGFNHFFRGSDNQLGDLVYFQGHSSPGIYARSFLEGRLTENDLDNFRREADGKGLSSYPHPWLMPSYWQFPTVSMGLGPIFGIYQAHIMKYLEKRGLSTSHPDRKVWVFCGDGEMDEPESMGAISLASRENLNNLVFVINCNLQRLDGPVRGNSQIISELGKNFHGAGWNVVNLIWGRKWDDLINSDKNGLLQMLMNQTVDGEYQNFKAKGGSYTRENFFGKHPDVLKMVENISDEQIEDLNRGGHDPIKIYNAYKQAYSEKDKPTVILAFTVKGYGIGSKQADNATHQVKKLTPENLESFVERFSLPIDSNKLEKLQYLNLKKKKEVSNYLKKKRKDLGGFLPNRLPTNEKIKFADEIFNEFLKEGTREASTTMVFVRLLTKLMRDKASGDRVVPIVPDEARTFGMDSLFRQFGIYSSQGQKYEPEDADKVMFYRESEKGILLEEGINEAGAFSGWLALATSYSNHKLTMVPFYIYYSMFGFQRIHDLALAAGDSRAKGFLLGATSGRTTLNGEGLQHQDGHSHILSSTIPNCRSYDPAFSYELAIIIKNGIKDMFLEGNDRFYYLTLMNENYLHPAIPHNLSEEQVMKGAYILEPNNNAKVRILASGVTVNFALKASKILNQKFQIHSEVWSITSFNELYREGIEEDRKKDFGIKHAESYVEKCFKKKMNTVAVSEYQRSHVEQIRKWVNGEYTVLGTDGYGRSDTRENLRKHFEISESYIVFSVLVQLGMSSEAKNYFNEEKIIIKSEAPWKR